MLPPQGLTDVFTPGEIARAAGVREAEVLALVEAGAIRTIGVESRVPFVSRQEAVRAGRALAAGLPLATTLALAPAPGLFRQRRPSTRMARAPFAISTGVHAGLIGAVFVAATLGLGGSVQSATDDRLEPQKLRLVYLALPGPGGGGGGGGLKKPTPPPKAERKGQHALSSPLPVRQPLPASEPTPPPLPEVEPEPLPPVHAPVVAVPSDTRDRANEFGQKGKLPRVTRSPSAPRIEMWTKSFSPCQPSSSSTGKTMFRSARRPVDSRSTRTCPARWPCS